MYKIIILFTTIFLLSSCKDQISSTLEDAQGDISPISSCRDRDQVAPQFTGDLQIENDGSVLTAPTLSWPEAIDNCGIDHYEVAIGTTAGGNDVLDFTNVGTVTSFQQNGLQLDYAKDYFFSVRAVDLLGNRSATLISHRWNIFTPRSLTNLVLWLDASDLSSLSDSNGNNPGENHFNGEITQWSDVSNSRNNHHFISRSAAPQWDVLANGVSFNGSNQFMFTADHADINLSTVEQRTLTTVFKTANDVTSTQMVFEEGGAVRGINIYLRDGQLHCGFWNMINDGDGFQPFVEVTSPVVVDSFYVVTLLFDYSNFNGANGVDGSIECIVNGVSIGSVSTTSRLFAHSGDIGLGAINQHTVLDSGVNRNNQDAFFRGIIYELLMYNAAHSIEQITDLHRVLQAKWQ